MAVVKVLARGWKIEIKTGEDGTTGNPIYTVIRGLTTLGFGSGKNDVNTTDFDSEGWEEHLVASRNRTLKLEGNYLEDVTNGARDPGQEAVDTLGEKMGAESLELFRLTSPGGTVKTFMASSNPAEVGGGNDDNTSWGAELTVSGKVTKV